MMTDDHRDLERIEEGLAGLFADEQQSPGDFTVQVLRRVAERRWVREQRLHRIVYSGLCAGGSLAIAGVGHAVVTLGASSTVLAMPVAVLGLIVAATTVVWQLSNNAVD